MRPWLLLMALGLVSVASADTLTLKNGTVLTGELLGFSDRKFEFRTDSGAVRREYAVNVVGVQPDAPIRVSIQLLQKNYDDVQMIKLERNTLCLGRETQQVSEPVILLKRMSVLRPPRKAEAETAPPAGEPTEDRTQQPTREGAGTGKWGQIVEDKSSVISRGEVIDLDSKLKRGVVNVIQFHYPKAVSSVRDGNYLEGLASRQKNRLVLMKVVVQDFSAPICEAMDLKTLPQFWFYSPGGKLVKKLTDRFTEGDIDTAIREAARR